MDPGVHPHVVRCHEVLRLDREAYLVLELAARRQWQEEAAPRELLMPARRCRLSGGLLLALQMALGDEPATQAISGFVHRDLKPGNALIRALRLPDTRVNRARVTDSGLVGVLAASSQAALELVPTGEPAVRNGLTRLPPDLSAAVSRVVSESVHWHMVPFVPAVVLQGRMESGRESPVPPLRGTGLFT